MKKRAVPGGVVGILHDGETRAAGFGVTNINHPLPVTDETLFQIGSITKTFNGTAIMRLAEMGKVALDATVRTFVPEFKVMDETASAQATIWHLLTHMGGWIGDFFYDTGSGDDAIARCVAEMARLEQLAPFNTVWSYCNSGFCVVGLIIERVTGKPYEDAMKELVFQPLGLRHCFLNPADVMLRRFVVGHHDEGEGLHVSYPWPLPRSNWPAGGIVCSVHDLLRYARFHMGDGRAEDGTRLLSPESLARMQTPQVTVWRDETWGLTWSLDIRNGTRLVGHGGGTHGQITQLWMVPERGFAVVVFTNAEAGGFVTEQATKWALKEYLGLEKPDPKPIGASEQELAALVGRYVGDMSDVELGMLAGRLIAQMVYKAAFPSQYSPIPPPPPPATLTLCEKERLLVLDGEMKDETVDVIRRPDGTIGWLRIGGRLHRRVT
jgi:CubicO group peptidase (beta-lactamase class C family)